MSVAVLYPRLKALHVASAVAFVGGMLAVAILLSALAGDVATAPALTRAVRRWDRMVTTPAMLAVWALGLALASTGHWFTAGWLQVKLAVVLGLSGLHGVQSGRLRRITGQDGAKPVAFAPFVIGCATLIELLAVAKPF